MFFLPHLLRRLASVIFLDARLWGQRFERFIQILAHLFSLRRIHFLTQNHCQTRSYQVQQVFWLYQGFL